MSSLNGHFVENTCNWVNLFDQLLLSTASRERINRLDLKIQKAPINIIIPAYKESSQIIEAINAITSNYYFKENHHLFNIILVIYPCETDDTLQLALNHKKLKSLNNLYIIDESKISKSTCIGHARAVGFYAALEAQRSTSLNQLNEIILISMDADTTDISKGLFSSIVNTFKQNAHLKLISYSNLIPKSDMSIPEINALKKIEDTFFKYLFEEISIINGRAYAIRGDTYILSGGVDPTLALEDKEFGLRIGKVINRSERQWINESVTNSARRLYTIASGVDMNQSYESKYMSPDLLRGYTHKTIQNTGFEENLKQYAFGIYRNVLRSGENIKFSPEYAFRITKKYLMDVCSSLGINDLYILDSYLYDEIHANICFEQSHTLNYGSALMPISKY